MEILNLIPIIYAKFALFILAFTRISAMMITFNLFRTELITPRVSLILASILAVYVILFTQTAMPIGNIFSIKNTLNLLFQFLIGFLTSLFLNFILEIFVAAGQVLSTQFGFGMISLFDPRMGMITSLTHFYLILISLIFFAMNGHLLVIKILVESFNYLPIDGFYIPSRLLLKIANYASVMFSGAMVLAMILVLCILLTNISLAVMTKFAPQFNLFSVGINMTIIIGLVSAYLAYDIFVEKGFQFIQEGVTALQHLITSAKVNG